MRDLEKSSKSPLKMLEYLDEHKADIVMCNVWLTEREDKYDFTTFHNYECNTLMVPKPRRVSEITAIYTTLSAQVWLLFGLFFFVTGILLWVSAKIAMIENLIYVNVSRIFLDVISIATSHAVNYIPRQHFMRILLLR